MANPQGAQDSQVLIVNEHAYLKSQVLFGKIGKTTHYKVITVFMCVENETSHQNI